MAERIKKPPVTPEQSLDWLTRNDLGESVPQIADKDDYDVRTVRSHILRRKQERERNEARATVLRGALENHYKDLCNFALKLDPTNSSTTMIPPLPADDDIMQIALRQHLPRSPIWNLLVKKEKLLQENTLLLQQTKEELEQTVTADSELKQLAIAGLTGIIPGIILFFTRQLETWSHRNSEWNATTYLRVDPNEKGFQLQIGFSGLGFFDKKEDADRTLEVLRPVIEGVEKDIRNSESLRKLIQADNELLRIYRKLHEEISIIRLRRIVPGKCKFCPL